MDASRKPVEFWLHPEVVITRVFEAPRRVVFTAWTQSEHVEQWWGPRGFTAPLCELEVRPGGAIRIDMRAPDGTIYPMVGVYREIKDPERLVFTGSALDGRGRPLFEVLHTVTFAVSGHATAVTVSARVLSCTAQGEWRLAGMKAGWAQSLECLDEYLLAARRDGGASDTRKAQAVADAGDREITATRLIDAPRERVFEMWTSPERIARWWGPRGFTITTHEMDVRPGGSWRFVMHGPDGADYRNTIVFREIDRPGRLAYSHVSGPHFESDATFEDVGERTRLTVRMVFATAELREKVAREHGAVEGLSETLARLAECFAGAHGSVSRGGFA